MKQVLGHLRRRRNHCSLPRMCVAGWNLVNIIKIGLSIHDCFKVIFSDETKMHWFQYDGRAWCWVRNGESQLQARHVSQTIKHGGGAILCGVGMTSRGMDYMCKIKRKMTHALYLSTSQDGVMKTIELYRFNPSCVIFQHDNDPKHTPRISQAVVVNAKFWCTYLASSITWLNPLEHVHALCET